MKSEEKKSLRKFWKSVPPPKNYVQSSAKISALLAQHEVVKKAESIGLYSPFLWEPNLLDLWQKFPEKIAFPKIEKVEMGIRFHKIHSLSELKAGYSQIPEPPPEAPLVTWKSGDLVLIPGICFDKDGFRLGSGKGYYDRFLAEQRVALNVWGVTFHSRIVEKKLPREPHDIAMQMLVTENELLNCPTS